MSLKQTIKYRELWMGLAMMWIVWFHSGLEPSNEALFFMKEIGYGGVDIFFFASGIGCYFSLDKDGDGYNFIKRRLLRIIPTYWIFMIPWTIYKRAYSGMGLRVILGNIFCVQGFTGLGEEFNWYISAIWMMYLLAPVFKAVVDRVSSKSQLVFGIVLLVLFSTSFWDVRFLLIAISRIPIFFLGIYFGKLAKNEVRMNKLHLGIMTIGSIVGFGLLIYWKSIHTDDLYDKGYFWYPFILITPGVCMLISRFMELIKDRNGARIIEKTIRICGKCSFEIYLLHLFFFDIVDYNLMANEVIEDKLIWWLLTLLALIPACFILCQMRKIVDKLLMRFQEIEA